MPHPKYIIADLFDVVPDDNNVYTDVISIDLFYSPSAEDNKKIEIEYMSEGKYKRNHLRLVKRKDNLVNSTFVFHYLNAIKDRFVEFPWDHLAFMMEANTVLNQQILVPPIDKQNKTIANIEEDCVEGCVRSKDIIEFHMRVTLIA